MARSRIPDLSKKSGIFGVAYRDDIEVRFLLTLWDLGGADIQTNSPVYSGNVRMQFSFSGVASFQIRGDIAGVGLRVFA
jgi:hypothetical protein